MNGPFAGFNPITTRWAPANALAAAEAARLAYSDAATCQAQALAWGFDRFAFLDEPDDHPLLDTQAFVAGTDDFIIVSFRGTQPTNPVDWLTDLDAVMRPLDGAGYVHKGFYDALDVVYAELLDTLHRFQDKSQALWFTGHSLGAALATLAAARVFMQERKPVYGVHTFGQPRTGDVAFGNRYDSELGDKTWRFVNDLDIITRLPPRELFYAHVGQLMFFDKGGVLHHDEHFWNKFLMEIRVGIGAFFNPPANIKDHSMDLYVQNVARNQNFKMP